jgi:hypothetical protein
VRMLKLNEPIKEIKDGENVGLRISVLWWSEHYNRILKMMRWNSKW